MDGSILLPQQFAIYVTGFPLIPGWNDGWGE